MNFSIMIEKVGIVFWPLFILGGISLFSVLSVCKKFINTYFKNVDYTQSEGGWEIILMDTAGGISQSLGLLGTIEGMTLSLANLKAGDPGSLKFLISGLSVALWSTYLGLILSIFCSVFAFAGDRLVYQKKEVPG